LQEKSFKNQRAEVISPRMPVLCIRKQAGMPGLQGDLDWAFPAFTAIPAFQPVAGCQKKLEPQPVGSVI